MKFVKSISLFCVISLLIFGLGVIVGYQLKQSDWLWPQDDYEENSIGFLRKEKIITDNTTEKEQITKTVLSKSDTICVDTVYILKEKDLDRETIVEIPSKIPDRYIGMNREEFLQAMELYEISPPLAEKERGFQGLEVLSFSREKIVVQMNYSYIKPSEGFYLAVLDHKVVVLLENGKTVYIETDIDMDRLPESIQQQLIQTIWIENEKELYDFLEDYSS